jgi:hypothetical protein
MKKMSTKRQLLIAVTVGVVGGVVWSVYSFSPGGPLYDGARWIPKDPPVESNRVFHPKGFSIIPPPGWKVSLSEDGIGSNPGAGRGVRYTPRLTVTTAAKREHLVGRMMDHELRQTMFAGQIAYELFNPSGGGGDESYLTYLVCLEREGTWYELLYQTPNGGELFPPQFTAVPEHMAPYIQSFKLPESRTPPGPEASPASTQPAVRAATSSDPQFPEDLLVVPTVVRS